MKKQIDCMFLIALLAALYLQADNHELLLDTDKEQVETVEYRKCKNKTYNNLCVKNSIKAACLNVLGNGAFGGDLTVGHDLIVDHDATVEHDLIVNGTIIYDGVPLVVGGSGVQRVVGDNSVQVPPTAGTINLLGNPDINVVGTAGTSTLQLTDLVKISPYVVSNDATQTRFTSVQAAIDQAVADGANASNPAVVYLFPGTYTEDVTFAPSVHLWAAGDATIVGTATVPGTFNGGLLLEGINFRTSSNNSTFIISTGATVSLQAQFCTFTNEADFQVTILSSTPAFANVTLIESIVNNQGNNSSAFSITGGSFSLYRCFVNGNSGTSIITAGSLTLDYSESTNESYDLTIAGAEFNANYSKLEIAGNVLISGNSNTTATIRNSEINVNTFSTLYVTGTVTFNGQSNSLLGAAQTLGAGVFLPPTQYVFTTNNLSFDEGTTKLNADGQLIIGSGTSNPVINTLTQGTNMVITNGAGSISLAALNQYSNNTTATLDDFAIASASNVTLPSAPPVGKMYAVQANLMGSITVTAGSAKFREPSTGTLSATFNISNYNAGIFFFDGTNYLVLANT